MLEHLGANTRFSPIACRDRFLSSYAKSLPFRLSHLFSPTIRSEGSIPAERVQEEVPVEQDVPVEGQAQINPTVAKAVENMNSGDGNLQLAGAMESQYLMNPRARGVEQFNRWRQIMKINADRLPPGLEEPLQAPRTGCDSGCRNSMDFLSANTAQAPARKRWLVFGTEICRKNAPSRSSKRLTLSRSADMKDLLKPAILLSHKQMKLPPLSVSSWRLRLPTTARCSTALSSKSDRKRLSVRSTSKCSLLSLENATSGAEVKGSVRTIQSNSRSAKRVSTARSQRSTRALKCFGSYAEIDWAGIKLLSK